MTALVESETVIVIGCRYDVYLLLRRAITSMIVILKYLIILEVVEIQPNQYRASVETLLNQPF